MKSHFFRRVEANAAKRRFRAKKFWHPMVLSEFGERDCSHLKAEGAKTLWIGLHESNGALFITAL